MGSRTSPKLNLSVEALRTMYRMAYRVMGWFVNLEAVEDGLLSSRFIEYPFVVQRLDGLPRGRVLDVGCTDAGNFLAPTLASLGWQVYGIDIRDWGFSHPNFHFVKGDISRRTDFADDFFDCVYAVSTIEHLGLTGRYGVTQEDPEADFRAVREIRRILKPDGRFMPTLPYGRGGVVRPVERVYCRERLNRLLAHWTVEEQQYWYLDNGGRWREVSEEVAGRTRAPGGVAVALLEAANTKTA
jgi:SAM-dependent methyltransferase